MKTCLQKYNNYTSHIFCFRITDPNNKVIPIENMTKSLVIWIFFVIFNKMSLTFITSFILLVTILILKDFIDYYINETDSDKAKNLKDL